MNQKLISQVWGLVSADGAPLNETHVCDVSVCTGDVTVGNTLSPTSVTGAKYLLGERANTVDAIAVHPDVAAWLETAGMLTYTNVTDTSNAASSIWGSGGIGLSSTQVALFAGLRVVVDEQLPVICNDGGPAQYHCYLFGNGVMRTGQQFPLNIETEEYRLAARRLCGDLFQHHALHGHLLDLQLRRSYQRATARSLQLEPRLLRSPPDPSGGPDRERRRCLPAYHRYLRLIKLSLVNNTGVLQRGLLFFARWCVTLLVSTHLDQMNLQPVDFKALLPRAASSTATCVTATARLVGLTPLTTSVLPSVMNLGSVIAALSVNTNPLLSPPISVT